MTGREHVDELNSDPLSRRWGLWVALALLLASMVAVSNAFHPRPLEAHEVFVAQTSREMLARHDWVLPMFNGEPRLVKPPLAYWCAMAAASLTGTQQTMPEWVVRLPAGIAGVALVGLTIVLGRTLYGATAGVLAGLCVAATAGFYEYSNTARPEMLYGACCALMLTGFVRATQSGAPKATWRLAWLFAGWLGFGMAMLAKGPHVPLLIFGGLLVDAWRRHDLAGFIRAARPIAGVLLSLAVALPWVVLLLLEHPEAANVWWHQLTDGPDQGKLPWWRWFEPYYLRGIAEMTLPWVILVPFGLWAPWMKPGVSHGADRPPQRDLSSGRVLFWVVCVVVLVMQFSSHRRWYYLLPVLPALGVLMAAGGWDVLTKLLRSARRAAFGFAGALAVTAVALAGIGVSGKLWGEGGARKMAFANRVAEIVPPGERIGLLGEEPGLLIYRLNRTLAVYRDSTELAAAAGKGPLWVVLPPARLAEIPSDLLPREAAALDTGGGENERRVLVHLGP